MSTHSRHNRGPAAGPENRRALIAAARAVYAESGLSAPFSAVARRAGVGQGSLYRHFPDRTALAAAVFDQNLAELEAVMAAPERTLDDFLDVIVDQSLVSAALIELLTRDLHDPRVVHLGVRLRGLVADVVARETAAGRLTVGVDTDDVLLATEMLAAAIARSEIDARGAVASRARSIFRSAFRAG